MDSVPTVTDNLYAQGAISADAIGVYFAPTTVADTVNGELTFGSYIWSKEKLPLLTSVSGRWCGYY